MNLTRRWSWLLVGLAVFVVLGHVCAGPVHVHAGAVTTHSEDHSERGSDEAAHGGSCEAVRSAASVDAAILVQTSVVLPLRDGRPFEALLAALLPAPAESPPLFLLHASLLI